MKHGVIMVFLLILTLCLVGAVSAGDNVTLENNVCSVSEYQEEIEISVADDEIDEDVIVSSIDLSYDSNCCLDSDYDSVKSYNIDSYYDADVRYYYALDSTHLHGELFENADDILIVSTFNLGEINNKTIENVLNEILNASNGYVNNDNLLTLFSINTDLNMVFFIKKDESFKMAFYRSGKTVLLYSGSNGFELNDGLRDDVVKLLGINGAVLYFNIACLWANGFLKDKISVEKPYNTGIICESEILTLFNNDFQKNKFNLPLEYASDVLSVSRDSGNDAFVCSSSDEKAYAVVDMVDESMTGFLKLNLINETQSKGLTGLSKQIGIDAAKDALDYFKSQGIDIQKGCPYLYVLTSAGYVKLNGASTDSVINGLNEVLGLNKNIIPVKTPLWKDLVFYFIWINNTSNDFLSYGLKYGAGTGNLIVSEDVKIKGEDIAKDLGLINKSKTKYSKKIPQIKKHYSVSNMMKLSMDVISSVAKSLSVTKKNNTKSIENSSDINKKDDSSNVSVKNTIKRGNSSPYNILYTIIAMLLVTVFFGVGYSKR